MMSKTFCVNPWLTLHTKFTRGYSPCCRFNGTVVSDSIQQYVQSDQLIKIKQDLLNGRAIPECSDCWKQEAWGYASKRQRDNQTYKQVFQALYKDLQTPAEKFVEYYVRLGNHCNLRCTSCDDNLSSGWISENKKFNIATKSVEILDDQHEVWGHMRDHAATIGTIEFVGGEPFMMCQDAQRDLFKFLVDTGHASHIRIKYNTNGTRLPTEQLEYWNQFKAVEINVSADGIGKRFEYLRYPAVWDEVEQNIEFYKNLQLTSVPRLELTIMHTISIVNIGYVKEMLDYCNQRNLKIFINILEHPEVLNMFAVSANIKHWILGRIQDVDHPVIANMSKNLQQGANTVTESDILNFLAPLDQRRNLNAETTFPELIACLKSVT
jgi:sulfatase maturation enzyme AslB (radical SAM superfamily)